MRVAKRFVRANGLGVRGGPFAGMRYPRDAVAATTVVPKLLGSFELELHPVIDEVLDRGCPTILNIGCAEGYYAVGLALRLPEARVYAFDSDPSFRRLCETMASLNGVDDRVTIYDAATAVGLQTFVQNGDRSFIVCDCEGCELELLDPAKAPFLRTASILVELHHFVDRTVSSVVLGRFRETHETHLIASSERDPKGYEELSRFSHQDAALAVAEFRPEPMEWAWMKPLDRPMRRRPSEASFGRAVDPAVDS